jgi:protein tyrosine phosphatase (PTP) superfamily phosphohydrolase (DUF442 family)
MVRLRWLLGLVVAAAVVAVPAVHYRAGYVHARRLRVVADGKLYRCGQLPVAGFREAFDRFGIRTVVNIREEDRDPLLAPDWLAHDLGRKGTTTEAELCRACGVNYVQIDGGVLECPEGGRPAAVDAFLRVCDDPANFPILLHCKAGRDRTGLLTAVWRMEYEGRTKAQAVNELRANGFVTYNATADNAYLDKLVHRYRPGVRSP